MKIMQTISQFIDYISIERRLSSLTVSAYTIDLNSFREFASQNQIENIEDVDSMLIRQWEMKLLEEENLSARSVCRKLAALRSWNKYLRKQNIVKQDFFVKVTAPKVQHQLPVFFRESEMTFGWFHISHIWSLLSVAIGVAAIIIINKKQNEKNKHIAKFKKQKGGA